MTACTAGGNRRQQPDQHGICSWKHDAGITNQEKAQLSKVLSKRDSQTDIQVFTEKQSHLSKDKTNYLQLSQRSVAALQK